MVDIGEKVVYIINKGYRKEGFRMQQKKNNTTQKKKTNGFSIVSLVLGLVTLVVAALYLVYRFLSDRAYHEKWKDYDDCGLA